MQHRKSRLLPASWTFSFFFCSIGIAAQRTQRADAGFERRGRVRNEENEDFATAGRDRGVERGGSREEVASQSLPQKKRRSKGKKIQRRQRGKGTTVHMEVAGGDVCMCFSNPGTKCFCFQIPPEDGAALQWSEAKAKVKAERETRPDWRGGVHILHVWERLPGCSKLYLWWRVCGRIGKRVWTSEHALTEHTAFWEIMNNV